MLNPAAVADSDGEWFELFNRTDSAIELMGLNVRSEDGDGFVVDETRSLPAWSRVVLGVNADTATNGGATVDLEYDSGAFMLGNTGDSINLYNGDGSLVSGVAYDESWTLEDGVAIQLDIDAHWGGSYSSPGAWCLATGSYGDGDLGTPHAANTVCIDVDEDADGDGFTTLEGDCDDSDSDVYPDADEVWDEQDNDCDGIVDNLSANSAVAVLDGVETDFLGWQDSVSVGDLDGDGQLDVIVGGTYVNEYGTGGVYALDGAGWTGWSGHVEDYGPSDWDGAGRGTYFGTMGQTQGDINGDGRADLFVMGTDDDAWDWRDPAGAVFFGGGDWGVDGDASDGDILFYETDASDHYTKALSSVDFDGDGQADVFIGDYFSGGGGDPGTVSFFASASISDGGSFDLSDADVQFDGNEDGDFLGYALGGADMDGDGYAEFVTTAAAADYDGVTRVGCAYIVRGGDVFEWSGEIGGYADVTICGTVEQGRFGRDAVPQVVDFNGDGTPDLAISAPGTSDYDTHDDGQVFIFYSADSLEGTLTTDAADITLSAGGPDYFGKSMMAANLDGDGAMDLVVGAPDARAYSSSASAKGVVYAYLGADLADDVGPTFTITGVGWNQFGNGMSAGDLNGDGKDELLIASPRYGAEEAEGRVWIFNP
jgi:hypothetical protein